MKRKILIQLSIGIILFSCLSCLAIYKFILHGRFLPEEVAFSLAEGEFTKIASDCLADPSVKLDCYSASLEEYGNSYSLYYKLFSIKLGISDIFKPNEFCKECVIFRFYQPELIPDEDEPTITLIYVPNGDDDLQFMNCQNARRIRENWIYLETPFGCGG